MPTGIIPSGQSVDVVLGTNTGKLRTVVTLSGRDSGRVMITAKVAGSTTFEGAVGGDNEINMEIEKTLVISGASVDAVRIDDGYNRTLGDFAYTVTQYDA